MRPKNGLAKNRTLRAYKSSSHNLVPVPVPHRARNAQCWSVKVPPFFVIFKQTQTFSTLNSLLEEILLVICPHFLPLQITTSYPAALQFMRGENETTSAAAAPALMSTTSRTQVADPPLSRSSDLSSTEAHVKCSPLTAEESSCRMKRCATRSTCDTKVRGGSNFWVSFACCITLKSVLFWSLLNAFSGVRACQIEQGDKHAKDKQAYGIDTEFQ